MTYQQLVCLGLGGIFEGYGPQVFLLCQTGVLPVDVIRLVDGKKFRAENRGRQHFQAVREKAVERTKLWRRMYPDLPLRSRAAFVDASNVADIVTDGSIVLLSPDNHATRRLVSEHACTLDNILLITGTNDAINQEEGLDGTEGQAIAHWRIEGQNRTAPITRYHEEIQNATAGLPTQLSCEELARSHPQLLATNLLVGQAMVLLLQRYLLQPPAEAIKIVEYGVNSREGTLVPYGIDARKP
jgi:hypothetical protein